MKVAEIFVIFLWKGELVSSTSSNFPLHSRPTPGIFKVENVVSVLET